MIRRLLDLDLPPRQSAFLWGPRKTGKTTYLEESFPRSLRYDLLQTDLQFRLAKEPHRLREELLASGPRALDQPVIIDEVQKVPPLLDEIHWLIENKGLRFILCGSSARKLRRGHANLLGGRAWRYRMHPLTSRELPQLDLLHALNAGLLPAHYLNTDPSRALEAYVYDYLQEEIRAEGLTRNVPAFSRFLDALAFSGGELVNYANVARDCGVDAKTVKEYFQILSDTMLAYLLEPWSKRGGRDAIIAAPRFYLFDVGVANALSRERITALKGPSAGRLFENFILMELMAHRDHRRLSYDVNFWRTKSGLEVDFVLGGDVAVEVKLKARIDSADLRGLRAFLGEQKARKAILVCDEPRPRRIESGAATLIDILPWKRFLDALWAGDVVH